MHTSKQTLRNGIIVYTRKVHCEIMDDAIKSKIFNDWLDSVDKRFGIHGIEIECVDYRGPEDVLFIRIRVDTLYNNRRQTVELRGGTAIMLPIIHVDNEVYTILVVQPRIASGQYAFEEIPAGMIDSGSFVGAAVREIEEELGIKLRQSDLIEISSEEGVYLSPGLLDEKARVFMFSISMSKNELEKLQGKQTGLKEEGEKITLKIIKLSDLVRLTSDGKALIAYTLYKNYIN